MTDPVNPSLIAEWNGADPDPADQSTYGIRGRARWAWEVASLVPGANLVAQQAYINALASAEAAEAALLNANFKGAWSGLSGVLNKPAVVSHAGSRWSLLNDLANVAASTPGVSADWELYQLPPASGVGYNPAGTILVATQVQAAINELAAIASSTSGGVRNRILNGDMRIAQYGAVSAPVAVAAGVLNVHLLDGWKYNNNSDATLSVARANGALPDGRTVKWLNATVGTADATIAAGQFSFMYTLIEGYDVDDLVGKTFTLHGFVKSSVTGVHCVELRNYSFDRHYLGAINIAAANTPQAFSLTVAGGLPSGGTWNFDNGVGLEVGFMLAAGSDFHGSAGSWQTGSKVVTSSQVNALATTGNVFGVAEIQLEPGAVVLPFERLSIDAVLAKCQRRYEVVPCLMLNETLNGGYGSFGKVGYYQVRKRSDSPSLSVAVRGSLFGGDSITYPSFSGDADAVYQTSVGVWNAYPANPRDSVLLNVTVDARL